MPRLFLVIVLRMVLKVRRRLPIRKRHGSQVRGSDRRPAAAARPHAALGAACSLNTARHTRRGVVAIIHSMMALGLKFSRSVVLLHLKLHECYVVYSSVPLVSSVKCVKRVMRSNLVRALPYFFMFHKCCCTFFKSARCDSGSLRCFK